MVDPLVSIIIPVYNRPNEFERALNSAIAQDYSNIEIIVVDDGSTEDIQSIARKYMVNKNSRTITYTKQENMGPGIARKTGLDLATGKYIQYLDADDIIFPQKVKAQVAALEAEPAAVVCICGGKEGLSHDLLELALNSNPWSCSSPLWHYPSQQNIIWPPLISGEDIVHFVSVGINSRKIMWLNEDYVQIIGSPTSLSNSSKSGPQRERRLHDNYEYPFIIYRLLLNTNLLTLKKYSEPLAERFYRIGFQFAMIGEAQKSINLLKTSSEISQMSLKKIEARIAIFLIRTTKAKTPSLYKASFKIHRMINSKTLHAYKIITSLMK